MLKLALSLLLSVGLWSIATAAQPVIIAHRGASGYLPEHTLAAKAMAHAMGADFIEQDVVLTKDNVPVVLHDVHLDTVTDVAKRFPERKRSDGRFYAIDFTLTEIKQLQVSERFNAATGKPVYPKRFPAGLSEFRVATLEEELQLIQGLNQSRGTSTGIYVELKQPLWHREQGRDISRVVLPILARYGYAEETARCFVQCFELTELRRMRNELGWKGRLVLLIGGGAKGDDGTDYDAVCTPAGLHALKGVVDGIGPSLSRVVMWKAPNVTTVSSLVADAHAAKLLVHPYTVRADELPKGCPSLEALHTALFTEARIDGVFSDFPDLSLAWVRANGP